MNEAISRSDFPFSRFHTKPVVGHAEGKPEAFTESIIWHHPQPAAAASPRHTEAVVDSRRWVSRRSLVTGKKQTEGCCASQSEGGDSLWAFVSFVSLFSSLDAHAHTRTHSFKPTHSAFLTVMLSKLLFPVVCFSFYQSLIYLRHESFELWLQAEGSFKELTPVQHFWETDFFLWL